MTTTAITDGLHSIALGAVNVFLIDAPDGLVLIDTGLPGSADAILGAMSDLGRAPGDLRHIVITHAHPDHIGSLAALVRATGAQTWIHPLDAPIAEGKAAFRPMHPAPELLMKLLFFVVTRSKHAVEPATIDHLIQGGETLPIGGGLTAVHLPGHCAGQVGLLWQGGRVLFAADACANLFGLGSPIGYEDLEEGRRSQKKLAGLGAEIACFGHGKAILGDASGRFRKTWG